MAVKVKRVVVPPPPPQPMYAFRKGFSSVISPDVVAARRDYLQSKLGHLPSGKEILEDARPVGSPLHNHFLWDNDVAAERYRVIQAKELFSAVRITTIKCGEEVFTPALIAHTDESGHRGYMTVQLATAPEYREQTLADIIRRYWTPSIRDRTLDYDELEPLWDLLDELHTQHCT